MLTDDISTVTDDMLVLTDDIRALTDDIVIMIDDIGALTDEVGVITAEVGALTAEVGALTAEVGALTAEVGALTAEVGALTAEEGALTVEVTAKTIKIKEHSSMKLPTCQNCDYKWTWKMTMQQIFRFNRKLACPNCKEIQFQSKDSHWKMNMVGIGPYILIPFLVGFQVPIPILISYAVIAILVFLLISPYFMKLSNEEEPLF